MRKNKNRIVDILITVFISCFIGMVSGGAAVLTINNNYKNIDKSDLGQITELYETIMNEYYDNIDSDALVEGAMSGMLSVLDPNSSYLNESATNSFNNKMQGEYYGVGIEALTLEDMGVLVVGVLENSPAELSGIREGDIIVKINGISLKDKNASYFTSLISELEDNDINLVIERDGEAIEFKLNSEKIVISSVSTNTFYKNGKRIGYIKIDIFAANTANQFINKLTDLESSGIDSLIIDVRDNAGGYLSNATTILELFMKQDTIIYKTESKDTVSERKDLTKDYRDYPVVVLVNSSSASASEVLAACFKENYGATLVGEKTYGKGTVQETISVLESSMVKITTKKWLTPNGDWVNGIGITPDVEIEINDKYLTNPIFDNDNQLSMALNLISK